MQARTLDLVEFCQVCPVDGLIPEDPVDGEVLGRLEAVLGEAVQHAGRHRGGVGAQKVLLAVGQLPAVAVARGAVAAVLVHVLRVMCEGE